MKPAEAGTHDIVAGHVHGDEVGKGVLMIAETGQWRANVTLKRPTQEHDSHAADVTLPGDVCAWFGRARVRAGSNGQLELTGEGTLCRTGRRCIRLASFRLQSLRCARQFQRQEHQDVPPFVSS